MQAQYRVNMSANYTGETHIIATNEVIYHFNNSIPIPSYLLAMAVGNLTTIRIGVRTSIISEPEHIAEYAKILSNLEELLSKVESYVKSPYIWGTYNILVLPPSFPVGGMENPLLTFASPTIMIADGSQTYVATHEIAHSWTGNLVTCRDWSNLWLNEGFTTFIERKVSAQIHGADFALIENALGNASLYEDMQEFGLNHTYSSLYPLIAPHNPDSASSEVPYEKG